MHPGLRSSHPRLCLSPLSPSSQCCQAANNRFLKALATEPAPLNFQNLRAQAVLCVPWESILGRLRLKDFGIFPKYFPLANALILEIQRSPISKKRAYLAVLGSLRLKKTMSLNIMSPKAVDKAYARLLLLSEYEYPEIYPFYKHLTYGWIIYIYCWFD